MAEPRAVLVTGGASGIGAAIVEGFLESGHPVAVADRAYAGFGISGLRLDGPCDVRDAASIGRFVERARDAFGPIGILVNNVGIYPMKPFLDTEDDDWTAVLNTNLLSAVRFARALLPDMIQQGWGRIVNISSNSFFMGVPGLASYVASKGALIGFARSLASEFGPHGVTVNCVAPNFTRTAGTVAVEVAVPGIADNIVAGQAIPRLSTPRDLVGVVHFLASDAAAFITGQTFVADGGLIKY